MSSLYSSDATCLLWDRIVLETQHQPDEYPAWRIASIFRPRRPVSSTGRQLAKRYRMNCNICQRQHHPSKRPFLCTIDARNVLHQPRLQLTAAVIQLEALEQQIDALHKPPAPDQPGSGSINYCLVETARALDSAHRYQTGTEAVEHRNAKMKQHIAELKESSTQRSAFLADACKISEDGAGQAADLQQAVYVQHKKWGKTGENLREVRSALCVQLAKLNGLRVVSQPGSSSFATFMCGIEMITLDSLKQHVAVGHNSSNDQGSHPGYDYEWLTNSLGHVARMLCLAATYLSLRLPAEILLPNSDNPRTHILPLEYSYKQPPHPLHITTAMPRSTSSSGMALKMADHGHGGQWRSKARPLYLDKPLAMLIREDSVAYAAFIDGVALLTYNICYACATQGASFGERSSMEEFCNVGRNMVNFFFSSLLSPQQHRRHVPQQQPPNFPPLENVDETNVTTDVPPLMEMTEPSPHIPKATLGKFSHGAAWHNLDSVEGDALLANAQPRLPAPVHLADKLRKILNPTPGWEMLEHPSSDSDDEPLLVDSVVDVNDGFIGKAKGKARSKTGNDGADLEGDNSYGVISMMSEAFTSVEGSTTSIAASISSKIDLHRGKR